MHQNRVRLCTLGFDSSRAFRVLHLNIAVLFGNGLSCILQTALLSEIRRQSPSSANSCTTCTLGLSFEGRFLVFHLKSVGGKTQIKLSPFPHVFGLRRLQSNPPRSLWLQHFHRMCCLTRRAHTAVHSNRVWGSRPYCHSERSEESSVAKCGLRLDSSALLGMTRERM